MMLKSWPVKKTEKRKNSNPLKLVMTMFLKEGQNTTRAVLVPFELKHEKV